MLRALDQLDGVLLSSVTGGRTPFFSPDSRWIGFFEGGDLKKVAVTGEPVITLCRELGSPEGGTWGDDGTIVVSSEDGNIGLRRVSADGGEATVLTKTDAAHQGHRTPSMLPGGRGVLFTIWGDAPEDMQLAVLDLKSGQQKTLLRGGVAAEYLDTGHLVYATVGSQGSDQQIFGTLWVVAFDLDRLALRGEPVRVSETLQVDMFVCGQLRRVEDRCARLRAGPRAGAVVCVGRPDRARDGNRRAAATPVRHHGTVPRRYAPGLRDRDGSLIFGPGILHENP